MRAILTQLYQNFAKTKLVLLLCTGLVYVAVILLCGGTLWQLLRVGLAVLVYIILPGLLVAAYLPGLGLPAGLRGPLAVLAGCALLAGAYCAAMLTGAPWVLRAVPPLLALLYVVPVFCPPLRARLPAKLSGPLPAFSRRGAGWPGLLPHQWLLALLFGGLLVLYALCGVAFFARPAAVGPILPSQDLLWNAGNAASFKLGFPPTDIRFSGVPLRYHYGTELLAGALSLVSGVSCYAILAFYLQPFTLAALLLCLYRLGLLVYKNSRVKALLLVFSFFLLGCATLWRVFRTGTSIYWNLGALHLVTNLNSQATGTLFLSIFCGLLVFASRRKYRISPACFLCTGLSFAFLCVSKGPMAAIVACALGITLFIGFFLRQTGWRGLALGALLGAVFLASYRYLYTGGAGSSVLFNPTGTLSVGPLWGWLQPFLQGGAARQWLAVAGLALLQSFLTMPAQFSLFVYGLARDLRHPLRLAPERLLFSGAAVGGLLAYYLFAHYGMSQMYFLFCALFFINLLAVDAAGKLKPPRGWLQKAGMAVLGVCAAVGVAGSLFFWAYLGGSGTRQLLRSTGLYPQKQLRFHPATPSDEAAALWLQQNTPQNAVFATNRVYESYVSQFFSAVGERQSFMEGYHYTKTNMEVADSLIQQRWQVLLALFGGGTPAADIAPLARANGIDYLVFVDVPNDIGQGEVQFTQLQQVFTSDTVRIYKIPTTS